MTAAFIQLFINVLNKSITAGWIVLAVMLLRILLRKMPKRFTCALWALVGIRLLFSFSVESMFSLIPSANTIPETFTPGALPEIDSGIPVIDRVVNPAAKYSFTHLSEGILSANPDISSGAEALERILQGASLLWLIGAGSMFCYLAITYLRLQRKLRTAVRLTSDLPEVHGAAKNGGFPRKNHTVWQSEFVDSPFILGLVHPKIYIPYHMSDEVLSHVIAHENAHLKRKDHLVKAFAFCLLAVYWFHPLLWAAFLLLCRDIELACDETVIRTMDESERKSYLYALIGYDREGGRKKIPAPVCPLAFGEVDIKERIVRAKTWKKPAFVLTLFALILCTAAAFCLLTDPKGSSNPSQEMALPGSPQALYAWRTPYIGDNSAVGNIIYNLTFPEDMAYRQFALQTDDSEPYAVTITFALSEDDKEAYALDAPDREEEVALLRQNACMMFSLIGNAEIVNFKLVDEADENLRPLTLVYTRQWAEHETDCDLWEESETEEQFEALSENLRELFSPYVEYRF